MAESDLHKYIKTRVIGYLRSKGYKISRSEIWDRNLGRVDVWGINTETLDTVAVEVKVSIDDYKAGRHKERRFEENPDLSINEFYIACPDNLLKPDYIFKTSGLLWCAEDRRKVLNKKDSKYNEVSLERKMQTLLNIHEPFYNKY